MAFRAPEAAQQTRQDAIDMLARPLATPDQRAAATSTLDRLIGRFGPFVETFPLWHPLVSFGSGVDGGYVNEMDLYPNLDHICFLRNAIVSCPYEDQLEETRDALRTINARLPRGDAISVEAVDGLLYHESAKPLVIFYDGWGLDADYRGIFQRHAVGRMLETEMRCWRTAQVGETVDAMRRILLGAPHGRRSSLFVNEVVGQVLLDTYKGIVDAGIFGPVYGGKA